ncbi:hypothetical protein BX600DRAFT_473069 [Xylariales sp. PMI_506]|nr:hypothetical protein BX600DRAFT_473069 [Xylariales sp. PMI_506]
MTPQTTTVGTPAPYGHACTSCAQSKCKCIVRPTGGPCERCLRLQRQCRPAESVRRRSQKKPNATKAARLEEKLDSLVSLIKSGAVGGAIPSPQRTPPHSASNDDNLRSTSDTPEEKYESSNNHLNKLLASLPAVTSYIAPSYEPSPTEAEKHLENFRKHKSKYFAFVHIPRNTSAAQLQGDRPFLWLCIMMLGSKSTLQQQILGGIIREKIAQEMVIQSNKSLDLLLGILGFTAWANIQFKKKPFLSLFTQMANSLVFDLGLNRPTPDDTNTLCENKIPLDDLNSPVCGFTYTKPKLPRTMEERRAVLGCFLITSIVSTFIRRTDGLRWTPYMSECLQTLDELKECPNDEILVQQVRMQLIIEKAKTRKQYEEAMGPIDDVNATTLYLAKLQSQLGAIKTELLSSSQTDKILLLHLYGTELETAHFSTPQDPQYVSRCLQSIESWFEVFFTIMPSDYIGFPFSIMTQLYRCMTSFCRLNTLQRQLLGDGASRKPVIFAMVDRVITNMEQVAIFANLDNSGTPQGDVYHSYAQTIRTLRSAWEGKIQSDDQTLLPTTMPQMIDDFFLPIFSGMEFFDNDWLEFIQVPPN